jgi:hypothetical protein
MDARATDMMFEGSAFSFLYLLDISPDEAHATYKSSVIRRMLEVVQTEIRWTEDVDIDGYVYCNDFHACLDSRS